MLTVQKDFGAPFRARLIRSRKTEGNTFNESREMAQKRKAARGYAADVRRRLFGG